MTTRLIVRVRGNYKPDALQLVVPVVLEPIHFMMERGMLQGIKSRAEKLTRDQATNQKNDGTNPTR